MDRLLTAEQLSKHIQLTPRSILRAAKAGRMPSVKVVDSPTVRFRLEDVLEERRANRTVRQMPATIDTSWRERLEAKLATGRTRVGTASRKRKAARG